MSSYELILSRTSAWRATCALCVKLIDVGDMLKNNVVFDKGGNKAIHFVPVWCLYSNCQGFRVRRKHEKGGREKNRYFSISIGT
jgi:hypothetical protein